MSQELQSKPLLTLDPNATIGAASEEETELEEGEELEVTSPETPEEGDEEEDLDLEAILGDDPEEKKEPIVADPSTPEFKELAKQFQDVMGVDITKALEQFNQMTEQMAAMQSRIQETESRDTLASLQDSWDITPTELDRRVDKVLKVFNKMNDAQKKRYDSLDGIKALWTKIESSSAKSAPASGGEKKSKGDTKQPSYKTSDLRKMMRENPSLYDSSQALIQAAYKAGRVTDD